MESYPLEQRKICSEACSLFLQQGFDRVNMTDIAAVSNVTPDVIYKHFGNKQDIILFLYLSINADWEIILDSLNSDLLHQRFEQAVRLKLQLMAPHADVLRNIIGMIIGNPTLSFTAARTQYIRALGIRLMKRIVDGSKDAGGLKRRIKKLPAVLYLLHWGVLFLYLQQGEMAQAEKALLLITKLLKRAKTTSFSLVFLPMMKEVTEWASELLDDTPVQESGAARNVLKVLFNYRKHVPAKVECLGSTCEKCFEPHSDKVEYFIRLEKPVHFILPAFPAKSPNMAKVLGALPDLGEEVALLSLNTICKEIAAVYKPGARITICSDGRIFADLVGVSDEAVSLYTAELRRMLAKLNCTGIDILNLEDLLPDRSFDEARMHIISNFSEPMEALLERVKTNEEFRHLFNGIHRFISDDRLALDPMKSKNKIKEESKLIALEVIRRSNAWTRFLSYFFPDSVRLSIHPHPVHSDKLGIRLTKAVDDWLTPWHGTIVLEHDGYLLMKKEQAEKQGASLVMKDDRPYYYSLIEKK